MSAAPTSSPRTRPAVASVGAVAPVAVSSWSLPVPDARTLLSLGSACRRAAVTFAVQADQLGRSARARGHTEPHEAFEAAQRAFDLETAAQHLQAEAQDAELQSWLAHRAAGGSFILVPPAQAVVVARGEGAPEPMTLVQRLGRALDRLPVFRRAA